MAGFWVEAIIDGWIRDMIKVMGRFTGWLGLESELVGNKGNGQCLNEV